MVVLLLSLLSSNSTQLYIRGCFSSYSITCSRGRALGAKVVSNIPSANEILPFLSSVQSEEGVCVLFCRPPAGRCCGWRWLQWLASKKYYYKYYCGQLLAIQNHYYGDKNTPLGHSLHENERRDHRQLSSFLCNVNGILFVPSSFVFRVFNCPQSFSTWRQITESKVN